MFPDTPSPAPSQSSLSNVLVRSAAALIAANVVILAVVLNTAFQSSQNYTVDVENCTCDCWDRKFKGGYNATGFRHVYFQMNTRVAIIWIITALYFSLLLKFTERAVKSGFQSLRIIPGTERIRWGVLAASCINFYGQFYCWWITINYLNDAKPQQSFNKLLPTQLYFNITDLLPAFALYSCLSTDKKLTPPPTSALIPISLSVSISHIVSSLWDQGLSHLLSGRGAVARDFMFIMSDLAAVIALAAHLERKARWKNIGQLVLLNLTIYGVVKYFAGYDE